MNSRLIIVGAVAAVSAWGQRVTDRRNADIRGGGGEGKCTIEVVVDSTAEIEIRGTSAAIRTLSGNPSTFRRFECNQPMPERPSGFRFQGVDGRGNQQLVRPAGDGGPAVIRIDDPKGGSEGYTFDITWAGGGYNSGGGGGGYRGGSGGGYGGNDRGGYGNDRGGYGGETYLGQANVDGSSDHDEISVGNGEAFRSIQLRVQGGSVEFQRVVLHYANGQSETLRTPYRIDSGGSTRWVDLPGDRRRIRSVELWYSRGRWGNNRPRVQLFGRN